MDTKEASPWSHPSSLPLVHAQPSHPDAHLLAATSCSTSSSSANNDPNTSIQAIANSCKPRSQQKPKRRRRSRARPPDPINRVLAHDKAHFKALVCQFTDKAASHIRSSSDPSPLSAPTSSLQPPAAPPMPPNPVPADLGFDQSLRSTLYALLADCLELLRGLPDSSSSIGASAQELYTSSNDKARALLEELNQSEWDKRIGTQARVPLSAVSSASREAVCTQGPERRPYFIGDDGSILKSNEGSFLQDTVRGIAEFRATLQGASRDVAQPHRAGADPFFPLKLTNDSCELDGTHSQVSNVQQSLLSDQGNELESLLFEGLNHNDGIDYLFPQDSSLLYPMSSHHDLLTLS